MPETKKTLVAFDPARPKGQSSDFLVPFQTEGRIVLYGVKSGSEQAHGLMVYLGRAITENDLFAKLVDSGVKIDSVDETLTRLRRYLEMLQSLRIGNVVRLQVGQEASGDFELELVAKSPAGVQS